MAGAGGGTETFSGFGSSSDVELADDRDDLPVVTVSFDERDVCASGDRISHTSSVGTGGCAVTPQRLRGR